MELIKGEAEVNIFDREDKQGVIVQGLREKAEAVLKILKENFPDAIFHISSEARSLEELEGVKLSWAEFLKLGRMTFEVEFPYPSKLALDDLRRQTTPTLPGHHQLKIIDSRRVDDLEGILGKFPQKGNDLAQTLKNELIYSHYSEGKHLSVYHIKPDAGPIEIRGRIKEIPAIGQIRLERRFKGGGSYDGLGVPKEEGDWGIMEIKEGNWWVCFSYFSSDGRSKGEIFSINTPVEFYRDYIYYVDLEIDVVKFPCGETKIIDVEELEERVNKGIISTELANKAKRIAEEIKEKL